MTMAIPMLSQMLTGGQGKNKSYGKIIAIAGIVGIVIVLFVVFGKKITEFFKKLNPFDKAGKMLGGLGNTIMGGVKNLGDKAKEGLGIISGNVNDQMERLKRETGKVWKTTTNSEIAKNAREVTEKLTRMRAMPKQANALKKGSETLKKQWNILTVRQNPIKPKPTPKKADKTKRDNPFLKVFGGKKK